MRTLDNPLNVNLTYLSALPVHYKSIGAPKNIQQRQGKIKGYFVTKLEIRDGETHNVYEDKKALIFVDSYGFTVRLKNKKARLFNRYSWFYLSYYDINLVRKGKNHLELVDSNNSLGYYFFKNKAVNFIQSLTQLFKINTINV